jgi:molybdenum cofactor cytidylyltransferase
MSRALSVCGVILAAGESSRMGTDKALLPWPPVSAGQVPAGTFLSGAIASLALSTDLTIVVAGRNESIIAPIAYAHGGVVVVNPAPERGQFSSLQVGLREVLNRGRDAAMLTLVDRPPVGAATVEKLRAGFREASARYKWVVIPEYAGKHGHPIVLAREMIEAFLRAPTAATARDVEHQNQQHIEYFEVDDPLVVVNINTPQEYAALQSIVPLLRE